MSKNLTRELGKGFSRSNIYNMRQLYIKYPIFQSVTGILSWTHYCELLSISDDDKRSFYEKECMPDKQQLVEQVKRVLAKWRNKE